jgi:hypothetical protein
LARSAKIDRRANAAEKALDSAERSELDRAELVSKRRSAGEGLAIKSRWRRTARCDPAPAAPGIFFI